tara:strand:- start:3854 stop:4534 length:681 start_codon:yes stop_codon:yes gene_type:complete
MKFKGFFYSLIIFITVSLFSGNALAAVINKYNFSYDPVSNLVEGNGLYWMRWDESIGLSIDSALAQFSIDGWRVATSKEMVDMYNVFIPSFDWSVALNENSSRGEYISVDEYRDLTSIFGSSLDAFGGISDVLFGDDNDSDGFYRIAYAQYSDLTPVAGIGADDSRFTSGYSNSSYSVQLVKTISIPEPLNTLWIVFFFFVGITISLKEKQKIPFLISYISKISTH